MVDLRRYKGRKSCPNWLKLWLKTLATDELATQSVKPVWLHAFSHFPGVKNHPPLSLSYFNGSLGDLYTLVPCHSSTRCQIVRDSLLWMPPYGRLNFWYRRIYNCQSNKGKNYHLERPINGQNMIVQHIYKCDWFTGTIQKMMISNKMNIEKNNEPSSMSW